MPIAIFADVFHRHHLFDVGDVFQLTRANVPSVRVVGITDNRWHDGVFAFQCQFYRRFAQRIGLFNVRLGRQMASRTLQVVRNRPVEFIPQRILDHVGNDRSSTAQLRMTERVTSALFRQGMYRQGNGNLRIPRWCNSRTVSLSRQRVARNFSWLNSISGNRITTGISLLASAAKPPAAAIQPA